MVMMVMVMMFELSMFMGHFNESELMSIEGMFGVFFVMSFTMSLS